MSVWFVKRCELVSRVVLLAVLLALTTHAEAYDEGEKPQAGFGNQELGLAPAETIAAMSSRTPEIDLDGDGRVDLWREFTPDGGIARVKYDNNGDGRSDEVFVYEKNRNVRTADENHDGVDDLRLTQWKGAQGSIERTQLERQHEGKWRVVKRTRVIAGKDLIEIREIVKGKEEMRYDRATLR